MGSRRAEVTNDRRTFHENVTTGRGAPVSRLAFGPFVLDPESGGLIEGERIVPLAPKPFETLLYLASHPGRVVSKSELMQSLWPDTFVTNDVLVQCVVEIRRALGDHAKTPEYVQTIPRRGYRFLAAVTRLADDAPPPAGSAGLAPLPPPGTRGPGRRRSAFWAAACVMALLAAGSWYAWTKGARSGLNSPLLPTEPGSLVVMPVLVEEPTPQSGWLHHGLAEMIRSQLGQAPEIHVVARHRVSAALAEAGYGEEAVPTTEAAVAIARKLRAERLVTGSFVRVDDRFVVKAQVVDVVSGRTEATASVRGKHPDDLLDAVDDLCLKMLHDLRPTTEKPRDGPRQAGRVPTQSIEAYREYAEALAWFSRGGRNGAEEAVSHLDQALTLDPSFALAYLRKAEIQRWRRQWGYGDPDPAPAVRAAARLLKDLPDRERLLVESFEALIVRKQPAAALEDWSALLQFYPTYAQEIGIPGLVADTFMRQGRWDELILVGEAHVESPSLPDGDKAWLSSHLAQAFRQKGEFERALDHARRAARLWPVREGPRFLSQRTTLGRISLEAGRRAEALLEFRAVASAPTADCGNLTDAAWGLYMAGEAEEASALVDRALSLDSSYGNAFHLRGWLQLARKDYTSAAATLETAFERTAPAFGYAHVGTVGGDLAALYYAGVAYQKLGQRNRAEAVLRRLMDHCQRIQASGGGEKGDAARWQAANFRARAAARLGVPAPEPGRLQGDDTTYFVQSSRLHAVQGKRQQALRELAQALALGHGEHQHKRDDPDFESLRPEPEFRRLVG